MAILEKYPPYRSVMKNILLILAFSAITVIVNAQKSNEFHLDQTYRISNQGIVYLLSDDADVTITGEDRSDVAVEINRVVHRGGLHMGDAEFYVEVKEISGDLHIIEHSEANGVSIGYISEDYEINILLPRRVSLDLHGDDDDYRISNVDGAIKIDADDADVRITSCNSSDFNLSIDDGDVYIDKASGSLKARVDDGDIKVLNASFTRIDIVGDDSYVYIATSLAADGDYDLRGDDATFDFDVLGGGGSFIIAHDDGSIRAGQNFTLVNESGHKSTFKLPGGTSRVSFRGDDIIVRLGAELAN
jgi:hypothetical protein